jgi:PII-like signaling protein
MIKKGLAKKLTIYVDESDKSGGKPVYELVMGLLYKNKIAGVSVFRGVAGYGSDGIFHTSKMLELSSNLPVKIEAVDSEDMIYKVLPELSDLLKKGLAEISDTTVIECRS